MWLLIDDQRNLNTEAVARTSEEGKRLLKQQEWECVCIDHDLGEFDPVTGKETNGCHIIEWAIKNNCLPKQVQIVTSNPVGRNNIAAILKAGNYTSIDGVNYYVE